MELLVIFGSVRLGIISDWKWFEHTVAFPYFFYNSSVNLLIYLFIYSFICIMCLFVYNGMSK